MASISSASSGAKSTASLLGVAGKGIGGLATGLNTDDLVSALTSGTQSKIAKQGQQKQLLNWKISAYRSMTTALNAFQSKFLKNTSSSSSSAITNITRNDFFNTYKATSSSSKVSASATTSSMTGNFTINEVRQLAESESFASMNKLSTTLSTSVGKDFQGDFSGKTLKLEIDGFGTKTIKLDDLNQYLDTNGNISLKDGNGDVDLSDFQAGLQLLIDKACGTGKNGDSHVINVGFDDNGNIKLDSDSAKVTVAADSSQLGLKAGESNRISTSTKIGALDAFKGVQGNTLTFVINGTEISVNKDDTISTLTTKITNSNAGVRMDYNKSTDEFTLTSKTTGGGTNIEMRDLHGNLLNELFGAKSGNGVGTGILTTGSSVKMGYNTIDKLFDDIEHMSVDEKKAMAGKLKNMSFDMTVNGITKTVKLDTLLAINSEKLEKGTYTADEVFNAINRGIQNSFYNSGVTFSKDDDGKTIISSSKGEAFSVKATGDFAKITGISDGSSTAVGNIVYDYGYNSTVAKGGDTFLDIASGDNFLGGSFEMTINGVKKTINLEPDLDKDKNPIPITSETLVNKLNTAIKNAFGAETAALVSFKGEFQNTDRQKFDKDGNAMVNGKGEPIYEKEVKLSLVATADKNGAVQTSVSVSGAFLEDIGFEATQYNNNNTDSAGIKLSEIFSSDGVPMGSGTLTVNGATVNYSENTSVRDFIAELNQKLAGAGIAGIKDGKLYIDSTGDEIHITDSNAESGVLKTVFGINGGSFDTVAASTNQKHTEGKNAEYVIDNQVYRSATNTVSYNNVNLTLNETFGVEDAAKIGVQSDPEDVINRLKDWMTDYNALVYTLNSAINEGKSKDYAPLTDEQKSGMTEDQIKTWEAEAKKGVLRNDQTLRQILADMRGVFYQRVDAAGISLYDIGIVTKSGISDPNEAGQLEFDKNVAGGGEERLRQMLINDPDKVRILFTDENGIGNKLSSIITRAANTSSVDRGSLVRIAGTEQLTGDNTSTLGDKISAIDKYIATLKSRLESEYSRYWKKFSSLETSVQRMNSQSSWLASQ